MNLDELRQRWNRMLNQAATFADLDNTIDARARARQCLKDIDHYLERISDPEARAVVARDRSRAARDLAYYEQRHQDWSAQVQSRSDEFAENEREAYAAPLPVRGLEG